MENKEKEETKEKVAGGAPETTTPQKNFENRKGLAESKLRGILKELELGMKGQIHMTRDGIVPIVVFVDEKKVPEAPKVDVDNGDTALEDVAETVKEKVDGPAPEREKDSGVKVNHGKEFTEGGK